jgi:hypothetical protein
MSGFLRALIEILVRVQVCEWCIQRAISKVLLYNHCEESLMKAPMEGGYMKEEILCLCCIYIFQCM